MVDRSGDRTADAIHTPPSTSLGQIGDVDPLCKICEARGQREPAETATGGLGQLPPSNGPPFDMLVAVDRSDLYVRAPCPLALAAIGGRPPPWTTYALQRTEFSLYICEDVLARLT